MSGTSPPHGKRGDGASDKMGTATPILWRPRGSYLVRSGRRGLGQPNSQGVYLQSTPDELQAALSAAQQNGVDPSVIQSLYNSGADPVQLALAATNAPLGPATLQSELDTVNTDIGASNYAGQFGVTAVPSSSTSFSDWWSQNWTWAVPVGIGTVLLIVLLARR
jgi:hypothetical protein